MKILVAFFILASGPVKGDVVIESHPLETQEEPDMCIGCIDKEEDEEIIPLIVEIRIDPTTGKIVYIIKNLKI
jgi:hypothetical protein